MVNNLKRARSLFLDGLNRAQAGDLSGAETRLREAVALDPHRGTAIAHLARTLLLQGRAAEARPLAEQAVNADQRSADAWRALADCQAQVGEWQAAITSFQRALAIEPQAVQLWMGLAGAMLAIGQADAAAQGFERALQYAPDNVDAWLQLGIARQRQWRLEQGLTCMEQVLAVDPQRVLAWERKGSLLLHLKRYAEALAALDQALALDPGLAQAWYLRGNTLQGLDREEEALAAYDRAIALNPRLDDAWSERASLYVSDVHQVERAVRESRTSLETFLGSVTASIRERPEGMTLQRFRLQHDLEQAQHLQARGIAIEGCAGFIATAGELLGASPAGELHLAPTRAQWQAMLPYLAVPYYHPMPQLDGPCLNGANDWAGIEEAYLSGKPQLVAIDNFLAPQALAALRDFALCSKIWLAEYRNRYLGAFANRGFATPLHLQLARELAAAMPRVFGNYRLTQLWGFKYDAVMPQGINVHADFARVNLNFWLTPDTANRDPESGGLKVFDVPSPPDWAPHDYNENEVKIYAFLKDRGAKMVRVPHRCNRAVLFNSALFHETDAIHFEPGYESRRLNFTYLFGRQL